MSPTLDGICTVSQNVPSGLTVSIVTGLWRKPAGSCYSAEMRRPAIMSTAHEPIPTTTTKFRNTPKLQAVSSRLWIIVTCRFSFQLTSLALMKYVICTVLFTCSVKNWPTISVSAVRIRQYSVAQVNPTGHTKAISWLCRTLTKPACIHCWVIETTGLLKPFVGIFKL